MTDVPTGKTPPIPTSSPRFGPFALVVYVLFAVAVFYAAFQVIQPFLTPFLLALVIVTLTYPTYERVRLRVGGRKNLAATIMIGLIILVLVIPAALLVTLLIQQAVILFQTLETADYRKFFASLELEARSAVLQRWLPWIDPASLRIDELAVNLVRQIPGIVASQGTRLLAGFFGIFIGFLFMILAAFVFYTGGAGILRELEQLSPFPDVYDRQIFTKFRGVVDATFRGQLLTALAQGLVAGVGLAIAGIPGAAFWGAVSAVFSLIPMVGAGAVWFPASLYLVFAASQGSVEWWRPVFLFAWGFLAVSMVDNFVRPMVMRSGVNMHPITLFFAIVGGLQAFGFTGLILGPLVFVLVLTVVEIYKAAITAPPGAMVVTPAEGASERIERAGIG
ncbi:MAG TPA: AI-2E family transporter [Thermoanaerobaculia bacterium]|nr:AI-2E family transporter [Thermoanaerobaculia bacterium]